VLNRFQSPFVTELSLYDIVHAPGVAIDLNHIDTPAKVTGFLPDNDGLTKALTGSDLVVIPAGTVLRKLQPLIALLTND
jgi:malate dehydrogenase